MVSNLSTGNEETEAEFRSGWIDAGVELNECLVEKAVEAGGLSRPIVFEVFSGFILASKFKQGGDDGRGSVLDSLIAGFVSLARLL